MGILRLFESGMSLRQTTLQKVLTGQMNPLERRLKLLERRRSRLFERDQSAIEASTSGDSIEEDDAEEVDEQTDDDKDNFPIPPSKEVEITTESPTKDQIRSANAVAAKYPNSENVVLTERGTIRVNQSSGGGFELEVRDVLERELGIVHGSGSTDSSAPSMSEVIQQP
jgi:hypothetical protein